MKNKIGFLALSFMSFFATAQQVPKTVIAEHFTNTYCSICASRNPALFNNLNAFPQVIHLAYYPSAPYAACPLSMHNPVEADARTNYYGIYGGTPQLVVAGNVITTTFADPAIFSSRLTETSSFTLTTTLSKIGVDSVGVTIVVKKVDTSSQSALQLYAAVVEDTLSFTASNGETRQYDVFRKAFWGSASLSITSPVSIGDSTIYNKVVALNTVWNPARLYATAILQQPNKQVVQASRSAHLQTPAAITPLYKNEPLTIYPNPATDQLFIDKTAMGNKASIIDSKGAVIMTINEITGTSISISSLKPGAYFLIVNSTEHAQYARFIKK